MPIPQTYSLDPNRVVKPLHLFLLLLLDGCIHDELLLAEEGGGQAEVTDNLLALPIAPLDLTQSDVVVEVELVLHTHAADGGGHRGDVAHHGVDELKLDDVCHHGRGLAELYGLHGEVKLYHGIDVKVVDLPLRLLLMWDIVHVYATLFAHVLIPRLHEAGQDLIHITLQLNITIN